MPKESAATPVLVALIGLFLTVLLFGSILSRFDWNPTSFVGFGEDARPTTLYAEERLDHQLLTRPNQGHDGKYFFVQANDPWVLDPAENAEILDYPIYRGQRMLYPLLAGGLGFMGPEVVVWGLIVVNVMAMALGTLATAAIAVHLRGSAFWGLAFTANLGFLYALTSDTAGILAASLALGAVALLQRDRLPAAIALLAAAVLAREVMILCALGVAMWLWSGRRRRAAVFAAVVPILAIGSWLLYLRMRLGPGELGPEALSVPFVGLVRAIPAWFEDPMVLVAGIAVLALTTIYVIRWARSRTLLGWAFVGFAPLATVLSYQVWEEIFDYTRALAPLLTAAVLLIFVEARMVRRMGADVSEPATSGMSS